MFVRVWQYEVVEGREAEFERVYGADGGWARVFALSDGYLGTELFRSISRPRGYLTVDRFTSPEAFGELLERHAASYAELDGRAEALTVDEREIATGEHL